MVTMVILGCFECQHPFDHCVFVSLCWTVGLQQTPDTGQLLWEAASVNEWMRSVTQDRGHEDSVLLHKHETERIKDYQVNNHLIVSQKSNHQQTMTGAVVCREDENTTFSHLKVCCWCWNQVCKNIIYIYMCMKQHQDHHHVTKSYNHVYFCFLLEDWWRHPRLRSVLTDSASNWVWYSSPLSSQFDEIAVWNSQSGNK